MFNAETREDIARILEQIVKEGLPHSRDIDVAIDAIQTTVSEQLLAEFSTALTKKENLEIDVDYNTPFRIEPLKDMW